jgi:hypothetical protein
MSRATLRLEFVGNAMPVYIVMDEIAAVVPINDKIRFILKNGTTLDFDNLESSRKHIQSALNKWAGLSNGT